MDSSPELKKLVKCHKQLAVYIRNNLEDIALFFHGEEIISHDKYREVTDIKSCVTDDEKARRILRWLEDKVEEDIRYYFIFTDYLKSKKKHSILIAQLSEEEVLIKGKSEW